MPAIASCLHNVHKQDKNSSMDNPLSTAPLRSHRRIPVAGLIGTLFVIVVSVGAAAWHSSPRLTASKSGRIVVVAGENFWGSLASQLGGSRVRVISIVSDPNADAHEYESSTANARAFAAANYVILNGAGYDDWGNKLLSASSDSSREVLTVADLLGKHEGDNPHFWYDPDYVYKVIDRISADYTAIAPADAPYFHERHDAVEASFSPYRQRLAFIKAHFAGTRVAATEGIFAYLASYTGLDVMSPPEFMEALSEGNDPPARSVAAFEKQLESGAPKALVYNLQTSTATTTNLKKLAAAHNIPVVGVTETSQPPAATFQEWMDAQLDALISALSASTSGEGTRNRVGVWGYGSMDDRPQ